MAEDVAGQAVARVEVVGRAAAEAPLWAPRQAVDLAGVAPVVGAVRGVLALARVPGGQQAPPATADGSPPALPACAVAPWRAATQAGVEALAVGAAVGVGPVGAADWAVG